MKLSRSRQIGKGFCYRYLTALTVFESPENQPPVQPLRSFGRLELQSLDVRPQRGWRRANGCEIREWRACASGEDASGDARAAGRPCGVAPQPASRQQNGGCGALEVTNVSIAWL
jgi:hypothetical protein